MVHTKRDSRQHVLLSYPGSAQKACEIPAAADTAVQKQEVVQLPLWKTEQDPAETAPLSMPSIRLQMQGVRIEIHEQAGAEVIRNTLLALRQLC